MKLNRRSVLGAIGVVGVGTGAAFGSGAFTSTTAERAVAVNVFGAGKGDAGTVPGAGSNNPVADSEQDDIADVITNGAVDVLVDLSSPSVGVRPRGATGDESIISSGSQLFPAKETGTVYSFTADEEDNLVSLVANDVEIVFGDATGLPSNSTIGYDQLFAFADPQSNSPDVTFISGNPSESSILTKVNGTGTVDDDDGVTVDAVTDGGRVSGEIKSGSTDGATEDLNIGINRSPPSPVSN